MAPARLEQASGIVPTWPAIPPTARPWTRWWWPGSGVDEANLTAQLEAFAKAGLGGVEITPIYGAKGYEERYVDFLSPRWMHLLEHTGQEGQRLGLGIDMATGTGWPFGGPWVSEADAAQKLVLKDAQLALEPTKQKVKRAAPGGEGWVLNPYSPTALTHYLDRFDTAFSQFPELLVRSQFHDSFEYYDASGTPELEKRFKTMHGYALSGWASVLMGEAPSDPDTLARLKADYRTTLDQLHQDYLRTWTAWAHRHGWLTRNQSHGAPANLLDLYGIADIPETEIFGSTPFPIPGLRRDPSATRQGTDLPEPLVSRMASSAAHVMGKPLVSCETATWLRDHWKVSLAYVKPELDRVLLDGINHVFYHGTVYSPTDAPWPGWLFYASTQFNPNNPWWEDFSALNTYVTRVQSVLQGGRPDNQVLLYWPVHDTWHDPDGLMKQLTVHAVEFVTKTPMGATSRALSDAGYAFDYISDAQLSQSVASAGQILTPGNSYATVVVPPTRHIPLETLNSLLRLASDGATLIFEALPEDVPGLGNLAERRSALQTILHSLDFEKLENTPLDICRLGKGRIFLGNAIAALDGIPAAQREPVRATGLDFIRRKTEQGWDYFIANLQSQSVEEWVQLGTPAQGASLLDPLTGKGGLAAMKIPPDKLPSVFLQLAPGESIILRTLATVPASGPAWPYMEAAGPPLPVNGTWSIEFLKGGPAMPESYATAELASWTESRDPEAQRFAGTVRYTINLDIPEIPADDWILDLGDVRESARVRINGQFLGTAWSLPFRIRLGKHLHPGRNLLEIEVTNTAANRIRDMDLQGVDWKIMREINFVNINYKPFDASGWAIEPAGLLGPVSLHPLRHKTMIYPCQP
ncbi:MAG TPA: glycosyl hydrolase [Oceanipulchritudo sp.]|nr:glycosyl hydrolase [Oceanipulchritudo sp.]